MSVAPAVDRVDEAWAGVAGRWGNSPRGGGPGIVVPDTHLQTTAVRAG